MIALLALVACVSPVPRATPEMAAALGDPAVDAAQLAEDRLLYVRSCGGCHALPRLDHHEVDAWPGVLVEMREDSKLEPSDEGRILRYIRAAKAAGAVQ